MTSLITTALRSLADDIDHGVLAADQAVVVLASKARVITHMVTDLPDDAPPIDTRLRAKVMLCVALKHISKGEPEEQIYPREQPQ